MDTEQYVAEAQTSIDKALDVCETLSRFPRGVSLGDLARATELPAATLHRILAVLKRRGYARQDEETQRYSLTPKVLDASFQFLARSELRLHAYPVLREAVLRREFRTFLSVPATDEVTYVWAAGPDEVAMRTVYGREMPARSPASACSAIASATKYSERTTSARAANWRARYQCGLGTCRPRHSARQRK